MTKTVVFFGAHHTGHLRPTFALVKLFVKAGYAVHYFVPERCKTMVEEAGAVFQSYNDPEQGQWELTSTALQQTVQFGCEPTALQRGELLFQVALPATVSLLSNGLVERVKKLKATFCVSDSSYPWGFLVPKILGIPLITSCSSSMITAEERVTMFADLRELDFHVKCKEWLKEYFNIDYDPVNCYCNYSEFTIVWSVPEFSPHLKQFNNARFFGVSHYAQDNTNLNDSLQTLRSKCSDLATMIMNAGSKRKKVVYVSMGTVVGQEGWTVSLEPFFNELFAAFGGDDRYHLIVSVGRHVETRAWKTPVNFTVMEYVPQKELLRNVTAFVTHCGNNSVHEAMFCGVPMIALPIFGDQNLNASHIVAQNIGVSIASPFAPDPCRNLEHLSRGALTFAFNDLFSRYDTIKAAAIKMQGVLVNRLHYLHNSALSDIEEFVLAFKA